MSMKRTKQRTAVSDRHSSKEDDSPWSKPQEPEPSFGEVESKPDSAFVPFAMSERFAKGTLILHPKFGKGLVVGVEGPRIEVLFKDGKKKLATP
jgi:hypothetical protein